MDFIEDYMGSYPQFMRTDEGSNNRRHHSVTGKYLKDGKQVLSNLKWDKELIKPIQIYKEQLEAKKYSIKFKVNVPIEEITFMEYDPILESEHEIEITDPPINGVYTYSTSCDSIIPNKKYSCIVKTPNDEKWAHGIPENSTKQNNIYDHDESLDQIGRLLNISRQTFKKVEPKDYHTTKPPYNNQQIESDYDYSMRLYEFCKNMASTALPLLYLKAWLNIDGKLVNREKYLCKMAPGDMYGILPLNDNPLSFEHRDQLCQNQGSDEIIFLYDVNTYNPLNDTLLEFKFKFKDSLWNELPIKGAIIPYVNGKNNELGIITNTLKWSIPSKSLGDSNYLVRFKYFKTESLAKEELLNTKGLFYDSGIYTDDELFVIVNYGTANKYVSLSGKDTNNGTLSFPYRTIEYGVSKLLNNETLGIADGDYNENSITVTNDINILSNPELHSTKYPIISNNKNRIYFEIKASNKLLIDNVGFYNEEFNEKNEWDNVTIENNGIVGVSLVKKRRNTTKIYP